jgi:crossover junction endodeoxyribonuclease RuvC
LRVLGIDPGTAATGYGIVDNSNSHLMALHYNCVITNPKESFANRLLKIFEELRHVIEVFHPNAVAIEHLYFYKNSKTAMQVGEARGVAILAGVSSKLEIFEYTPLEVKLALTGFGRAQKEQVQQMVKRLLRLQEVPQPNDAADALAVAICHIHSSNTKRSILRGLV